MPLQSGAPLIAIVACLGLAVDLSTNPKTKSEMDKLSSSNEVLDYIVGKMDYLRTSRPTAVNLFNAMDELDSVLKNASEGSQDIVEAVVSHAEFMLKRDVSDNEAIGSHGAKALLSHTNDKCVRMVRYYRFDIMRHIKTYLLYKIFR